MSLTEVVDQITYSFMFIVTPLEIISTKSIKNLRKSLLLKLGDKTSKTSQMNKAIEIPLQVMYSKTLKKYCPIKGIIKVYDINQDGSEVISSVGGFQTEQILNQQKTSTVIEKDIGTSKVKMKIQIKNLGVVDHKHQKVEKQIKEMQLGFSRSKKTSESVPNLNSTKNSILSLKSLNSSPQAEDNNKIEKTVNNNFKRSANLNKPSVSQTLIFITPIKKDSIDPVNSNLSSNELRQSISSRASLQMGNQARQQITKFNRNQKKQTDSQSDLNKLKKEIQEYKKQRDETLYQFQRFQQCFESKNNKIWVEFYEKLKTLSWKYKNKQFEKVFDEFFSFILCELQKKSIGSESSQDSSQPESEIKPPVNEDLRKRASENLSLQGIQKQKGTLETRLKEKQRQFLELENRIKQLQSFKNTLRDENEYMREKDETMQQIISQKENQIDNLKQEITQIQLEFKEMQATLKNDACEIEELKEEVSNLNQTIETYREKYGDLKNVKNRALENQLKECLFWIDQQTRDLEMSDFQEDTQASHSHNVSDIIKNIELEGTSREEMNSIKEELSGLIKRIDNFLAK